MVGALMRSIAGAFFTFIMSIVMSFINIFVYGIEVIYWKMALKKGMATVNKICNSITNEKKRKVTNTYSVTVEVDGEKYENILYKETKAIDDVIEYKEGLQLEIYWDEKKRKMYNYSLTILDLIESIKYVGIAIGIIAIIFLIFVVITM